MKKTYLEVAEVNFINDLEMTGKDRFQHANWPSFEGFWQNSVVGVRASADSNIPCLLRGKQD